MSIWECKECCFIYDVEKGLPEEGILPGTRWEDIPEDWICPDCGVSKKMFINVVNSESSFQGVV